MPAQEGIGLEDEEGFLPFADSAGEKDQQEAIDWREPWFVDLVVEDDELLAEEDVLGNELGVAASDIEGIAERDKTARRPGELDGNQFKRHQCGAYASDNTVDQG